MSWLNKQSAKRPPIKEMTLVTEKDMHPILFRLLSLGNGHPNEAPVRKLIMDSIAAFGCDTEKQCFIDEKGNLFFDNRTDSSKQTTLFSCHMDTVHDGQNHIHLYQTKDGFVYGATKTEYYDFYDPDHPTKKVDLEKILKAKQIWNYDLDIVVPEPKRSDGKIKIVVYSKKFNNGELTDTGLWYYGKHSSNVVSPSVLGADDKVGCYIMLRMIKENIPGLYVFHVGEERGCIGSRHILEKHKDKLEGIKSAIAFDRAGYSDVIAHQRPGRCASKEYTSELAEALNEHMPQFVRYEGDVRGMFTDTAIYEGIIPECANISVGYFDQHGPGESFDLVHLEAHLVPACIAVKWDALKIVRDPKAKATVTHCNHGTHYHQNYTGYNANSARISAKEVNASTPIHKCPKWTPDMGLFPGVGRDAMIRIMEAYYSDDCRGTLAQANQMYRVVAALDDISEQYMALRLYCAHKGILTLGQSEKLGTVIDNDNPMEADLTEKKAPEDFKEFVGMMNEGAEMTCITCHREWTRCICKPVRSECQSDTEFEYAVEMWESRHRTTKVRPKRSDFADQASFDAALSVYNDVVQDYIDKVMETTKRQSAEETLADPEVQARLEK